MRVAAAFAACSSMQAFAISDPGAVSRCRKKREMRARTRHGSCHGGRKTPAGLPQIRVFYRARERRFRLFTNPSYICSSSDDA